MYDCVWVRDDAGVPMCIFALNVYDWAKLGDTESFPKRGCVGYYRVLSALPKGATIGTELEFRFQNNELLDPFAE